MIKPVDKFSSQLSFVEMCYRKGLITKKTRNEAIDKIRKDKTEEEKKAGWTIEDENMYQVQHYY